MDASELRAIAGKKQEEIDKKRHDNWNQPNMWYVNRVLALAKEAAEEGKMYVDVKYSMYPGPGTEKYLEERGFTLKSWGGVNSGGYYLCW